MKRAVEDSTPENKTIQTDLLSNLTSETTSHIFNLLDTKSLKNLTLVNHTLNEVAVDVINRRKYQLKHKFHHRAKIAPILSPDGDRILTFWGKSAFLWDLKTKGRIAQLEHEEDISSAAFSPDGNRIITGSWDKTFKIWAANPLTEGTNTYSPGQVIFTSAPFFSNDDQDDVSFVAFSSDGNRIVTVDHFTHLWDARTYHLIGNLPRAYSTVFSPDGKQLVIGTHNATATVLNAETAQFIRDLRQSEKGKISVSFSPDGTKILTTTDESDVAKVWNAQTGDLRTTLGEHNEHGELTTAAFSPDSQRVFISSSKNAAFIWDIETGKPTVALEINREYNHIYYSSTFSSDGTRLIASRKPLTIEVWDANTGNLMTELEGSHGALLPNRFHILLEDPNDNTAQIWNPFIPNEELF